MSGAFTGEAASSWKASPVFFLYGTLTNSEKQPGRLSREAEKRIA
jgi:hypothetical protein